MEKQFFCIWTDKDPKAINSYEPSEREEKIQFFTEDNGYSKQDIDAIHQLGNGESYICQYGNHTIKRIK